MESYQTQVETHQNNDYPAYEPEIPTEHVEDQSRPEEHTLLQSAMSPQGMPLDESMGGSPVVDDSLGEQPQEPVVEEISDF
jgi:hypothetical protein